MKFSSLVFVLVILASTANAATTNLNNNRINTYDLFAEGHATIGSTWNTTEWGLVVVNGATLNSTLRVQGNAYFEGPVDFNGTVSGVPADSISSGIISRSRLPSELAYEDEANVYSLVQTFSDGVVVTIAECVSFNADSYLCRNGANSLNTTGAFTSDTLFTIRHHQVNGTLTAKTNSYLEGLTSHNSTTTTLALGPVTTFKSGTQVHSASTGGISNYVMETYGNNGNLGQFLFLKQRGASQGGTTSVNSGDTIGQFLANAYSSGGIERNLGGVSFIQTAAAGSTTPGAIVFSAEGVASSYGEIARLDGTTGDFSWQSNTGFNGILAHANSGARTYTFPDTTGGVGLISVANTWTPKQTFSAEIEIDGALNHDGTTVGFYGTSPATQAADIPAMTDNTGGTISSTCAAITGGAVPSQAEIVALKNCVASLLAKINLLETAIEGIGITA